MLKEQGSEIDPLIAMSQRLDALQNNMHADINDINNRPLLDALYSQPRVTIIMLGLIAVMSHTMTKHLGL